MGEIRFTATGLICHCAGCSSEPQGMCLLGFSTSIDYYATVGWVKCNNSGISYHPRYSIGCGHCLECEKLLL